MQQVIYLKRQNIASEASKATKEMLKPTNSNVRVFSAISIFICKKATNAID